VCLPSLVVPATEKPAAARPRTKKDLRSVIHHSERATERPEMFPPPKDESDWYRPAGLRGSSLLSEALDRGDFAAVKMISSDFVSEYASQAKDIEDKVLAEADVQKPSPLSVEAEPVGPAELMRQFRMRLSSGLVNLVYWLLSDNAEKLVALAEFPAVVAQCRRLLEESRPAVEDHQAWTFALNCLSGPVFDEHVALPMNGVYQPSPE